MSSTAYLLVLSVITFNLAYSDELAALRELYGSTGGPSWKNSNGWNGSNPCQGFYGVTCGDDGKVRTIDLKSNNLVGYIPESIKEFKMMTDLYLGSNALSGAIPRSIFQCSELLRLVLTSNQLNGTLPDLPLSLSLLAVDENSIGGPIPNSLANLEGLVTLALTDNQFTSLPTSLSRLGSLSGIYLSNNPIEGDLSIILPQLAGVTSFFAENCKLIGNFPDISGLRSLSRLYLSNNQITGGLPSNIGSLTSLNRLRLANNRMSGTIPASISNLKSIIELDLSGNFFSGIETKNRPSALSSCFMGNNLMRCPIPSWASTCQAVCDVTSNATVNPSNVLSEMQRIFQLKSTVFNIILTSGIYHSTNLSINGNGYEVVRLLSSSAESSFTSSQVTVSNVNQFAIDGIKMTESPVTLSKIHDVNIFRSKFIGSSTLNLASEINSASVTLSEFSQGNLKEMINVGGAMQNLTVGKCNFTSNSVVSISIPNDVQSINLISLWFYSNLETSVLIRGKNAQLSLISSEFSNNLGFSLDISNSNFVTISSSSFTSNDKTYSVAFRSGVKQVQIKDSKWAFNAKGGILLDSSSSLSLFQMNSSELIKNSGAIRAEGACTSFSVYTSNFVNNFAESDGGAVYLSSSSPSSFSSVLFDGNSAVKGGGAIISQGGNFVMQDVHFRNNSAQTGGAVHSLITGSCQLVSCNFEYNRAEREGGGMYFETSESILVSDGKREVKSIEMKQVSFSNNFAGSSGGGVRIYNIHGRSPQVVLSDSSLFKNSANQGSAISINGSFTLSSTTFKDNSNPQNSIAILSPGNIVVGDGNQFGDSSIWVSSDALQTQFSYTSVVPVVCQSGTITPDSNGFKVCGASIITSNEQNNSNTIPIAVGVAVGGIVLLLLVMVVVFLAIRRKKSRRPPSSFNFTLDMTQIAKEVVIDENDLKNIERVGEGAFGVVSRADWRKLQVAVKQMNYESSMGEKELRDFLAEVQLLHGLRSHPNVVLFIGIVIPPQTLSLVTEFCHGGSLHKHLQLHHKSTSMKQMKMWITGIALGLLHLHSEGIIHRDLAARNVLLTKSLDAKVCDFGLSRKQISADEGGKTVSDVGPIKWMPPEAIKEQVYGPKTDVYSFGILIFEILSGEEPYQGIPPLQVAVSVSTQNIRPTLPSSVDSTCSLAKLMYRCWHTDPAQRPSFAEICEQLTADTPIDTLKTMQVSQSQLARARDGVEVVYSSILANNEAQNHYNNV